MVTDFINNLLDIVGFYEPITVEYISESGLLASKVVPDFGYIMSFAFLIVSVFCIFKLIGGILTCFFK